MATTIDELQVIITAQNKQFQAALRDVSKQLDGVSADAQRSGNKMQAGFEQIGGAATKALKVGVVGAIAAVTASIPAAVKRIDTLNNAPKVLKNLGYAAEDSDAAMRKLDMGIRGLPTSLDSATSSLVSIASASGKTIGEATDLTIAFNNMALAGGKGPAEAQRAFVQFTQAVGRGKMGMEEFNTLSEVMPAQLAQVAKGLLGPTANAATLRDALSEGTVTMDQFMGEIMRLDKNGGAGFASFSVQAKDATAGIATGFANMKIGITRGVAAILTAIGAANITEIMGGIGQAFGTTLTAIAALITFIADHSDIFGPLAVGVAVAVAAIVAYNTYVKVSAVVTAAWSAASAYMTLVASLQAQGLGLLRAAWLGLNIVMAANPIGIVIVAVTAITAALAYFFTQTETGKKIFEVAMNAIKTAAEAVWNWIKSNWPLLLSILTGPIGAAVIIIVRNADTIKQVFSNALNWIKGVWNSAPGFFGGVINGVIGFFRGIPATIGGLFSDAWNRVKSIWSGVASWFSNIDLSGSGRALINSFVNGIKSMVGRAKDAASSVVKAVRDFFPFSPAKEGPFSGRGYTTHSGKALMQDFASSIRRQAPLLQKTMDLAIPNFSLPSNGDLSGRLDVAFDTRLPETKTRQIPIVLQLENGAVLGNYVIDEINGRAFMSNGSPLDI